MMMKGFMAGKGIHCNDVAFAGFVLCCESQKNTRNKSKE